MSSSTGSCAGERVPPSAAPANLSVAAPPLPFGFVRLRAARAIRPTFAELGADSDELVAEAGLDPQLFEDGSKPVQFIALGRLMALGADRTRCPHLGLLVGQRTTLASLGLLGLLMRNSETVGDALRALEAHFGVLDRGAVIGLGIYDDTAVISYAPCEPEAEGAGLHSEQALAKVTNFLRALCGADWAPLEVLLPRSAPHNTTPYGAFFRAPVRFDHELAALVLPVELLNQRITGANLARRRKLEDRIHRLEATQSCTLTNKLRRYLRTAVSRQRCEATRMARLQLITRRTLTRQLRAEGTTFRQLAQEVRFGVAKQLLADTGMSMSQISGALDFSEAAAFSHAFRRWSGMTPSAWRQANRPESNLRRSQEENPHPDQA